jgi:hypothetical protein
VINQYFDCKIMWCKVRTLALGELGLECMKLSKLEEEEAGRMGSYSEAGAVCQQMASQARKIGNATVWSCTAL